MTLRQPLTLPFYEDPLTAVAGWSNLIDLKIEETYTHAGNGRRVLKRDTLAA